MLCALYSRDVPIPTTYAYSSVLLSPGCVAQKSAVVLIRWRIYYLISESVPWTYSKIGC